MAPGTRLVFALVRISGEGDDRAVKVIVLR
jgi:hypothetical protein